VSDAPLVPFFAQRLESYTLTVTEFLETFASQDQIFGEGARSNSKLEDEVAAGPASHKSREPGAARTLTP
jgi:hypothetical protein